MIRLAHISDIHITAAKIDWRWRDRLSKRMTTWLNLCTGRGRRFALANTILTQLNQELDQREIDHVVFSGDATAMGFTEEMRRAASLLRVTERPGLAVPGNHDYCTLTAARSGAFEDCFRDWQTGVRIDNHRYPFAQRVGSCWLIGVNASIGHRNPFDASGWVGPDQCDRLNRLLAQLEPGPRILVIHYPFALSTGKRESWHHGLRDREALLTVAIKGGVSLWLHGHQHRPYLLPSSDSVPFPVLCAGTTTQLGICSYFEYTLGAEKIRVVRRVYDLPSSRFQDVESYDIPLPRLPG